MNTIYFMRDPRVAFKEFRRVLSDGGRLVLSYNEQAPIRPDWCDGTVISYENIESMLAGSGFTRYSTSRHRDLFNGRYFCTTAVV